MNYELETLATEAGYKSLSYVRKLCKQNLVDGVDYVVTRVKNRISTLLNQTQNALTWFSKLSKVNKKLTQRVNHVESSISEQRDQRVSNQTEFNSDVRKLHESHDDEVYVSEFSRMCRSVRDFLRGLRLEIEQLTASVELSNVNAENSIVNSNKSIVNSNKSIVNSNKSIVNSNGNTTGSRDYRTNLIAKLRGQTENCVGV